MYSNSFKTLGSGFPCWKQLYLINSTVDGDGIFFLFYFKLFLKIHVLLFIYRKKFFSVLKRMLRRRVKFYNVGQS